MAKKLSELIGNRNTTEETWSKIRAELHDHIADAFKLWTEFDALNALGRVCGFGAMNRSRAIEKILADPFCASPDWLLVKIKQLQMVTTIPPQADVLFDGVQNQYAHHWAKYCFLIVAEAVKMAEAELAEAVAVEEKFFSEVGLPRQATQLASGVASVILKLKSSLAHYDRLTHPKDHEKPYAPDPTVLPEIFADEIAKYQADLAQLDAENKAKALAVKSELKETLTA
jgi:hypothetical protein